MTLNVATIVRDSARAWPDKPALVIGDRSLSYAALHDYAQRFAGALKQLGIEPGHRVALMLPNVPQFSIAYFGGHFAATPIVPLNVLLTSEEIHYHLEDSESVALVVWEGFLAQARAAAARTDTCRHLIVARADPGDLSAPEGTLNMTALMLSAEPVAELPPTMPDDTAVILYTSGTTGRPKGAQLTHLNVFYNADYLCTRLLPLREDTVALVALPLFHAFGQTAMHNTVLTVGGCLVLVPRFDPQLVLELIERHRVTFFGGVPTMYFALLHFPEASRYDLSSLTYCVSGGSAMPVEVMRAFDERYGVNILEGYGLSETSPVACFNVLDRPKKPGSIGLPLRGVEFRLVDTEGKVITNVDEPGELWIKGHNVMKGYLNRPEATAEALTAGWFHTGDIATVDEDGYYRIVDRTKDMIIRGGYNVYPREIEEVLYGHPAVQQAAVVGVPDEKHGQEVKAILKCKPGMTVSEDEIVAYCRERLAGYKYPRIVEIREDLPIGPTGKVLKRELQD